MKQHHASRAVTASSMDCCMRGVQSVRDAASSLSMMSDTAASKSPWKGQAVFFEWSSCQFIVFSSRVWCDVIRFIVIGSQCTSQGTSAFDSAEVRRKACRLFHHLMWKFVVKTLKNNLWCYSMWVFGSWDIWCCYVSFFFRSFDNWSPVDFRVLTSRCKTFDWSPEVLVDQLLWLWSQTTLSLSKAQFSFPQEAKASWRVNRFGHIRLGH